MLRLFLSQNNKTKRQGEELPGHLLQLQSSPSKNFGAPLTQGNRKQKPHNTTARTFWLKYLEDPATRDDNSERIETEHQGQIAQKAQISLPTSSEPTPEKRWTHTQI